MRPPKTRIFQTESGPAHGFEARLDQIEAWSPVVTQVREVILRHLVTGSMLEGYLPPDVMGLAPDQDRVEAIAACCHEAIIAGRLIDFGDWDNDVIKHGGKRGGPLYTRGALGHPFRSPYVFMHTWENVTAVYLVNPLDRETSHGDTECIELLPTKVSGNAMLMISDQMILMTSREDGEMILDDGKKYHCSAIPSVWRFLPGADAFNNGLKPANAAAGNVLDPLMTALLILATRGIERQKVEVAGKLQKARAKNRKPPIPPYERVMSAPYVTAIQNRLTRRPVRESRGGTHASPQPHIRMGHPRTYANGVTVLVRDALVGMSEEARQAWISGRSHYAVRA